MTSYRNGSVRTDYPWTPEPETDWRAQAACLGVPTEFFFTDPGVAVVKQIRDLCDSCPVAAECLADAIRTKDYGFRAGTTERQRARIRGKGAA